jgi:hypothetical protein
MPFSFFIANRVDEYVDLESVILAPQSIAIRFSTLGNVDIERVIIIVTLNIPMPGIIACKLPMR